MRKSRSQKAGLPPGTLVHIGDQRVGTPRLHFIEYNETRVHEHEEKNFSDWRPALASPTVTWLDVGGVHDLGLIEQIGAYFQIHPLVLEDIVNTEQRPKVDDYGQYLYVVLKMLYTHGDKEDIISEQVSMILLRQSVLTFQENGKDAFDGIRARIKSEKGKLRNSGADYLFYALIDAIIDQYFVVLETMNEKIEAAEDELLVNPGAVGMTRIQLIKKDVLALRGIFRPVREVVTGLEREETGLISHSTRLYLRDVYDHIVQILETVELHRDRVAGMVDVYLSTASHRITAIMKVLTLITTIFMPLTFIAGIYGMNFEHMPELNWRWGYPVVLSVMVIIGISMVIYFKKKRWL